MKKLFALLLAFALCLCAGALAAPSEDRAGEPISLPETIEKIVSMAPSTTRVLTDLGLGDKLLAVDSYSAMYQPELAALPQFDMMTPDAEQLEAKVRALQEHCVGASRAGANGARAKLEFALGPALRGTTVIIGHGRHRISDLVEGRVPCTRIGID